MMPECEIDDQGDLTTVPEGQRITSNPPRHYLRERSGYETALTEELMREESEEPR